MGHYGHRIIQDDTALDSVNQINPDDTAEQDIRNADIRAMNRARRHEFTFWCEEKNC